MLRIKRDSVASRLGALAILTGLLASPVALADTSNREILSAEISRSTETALAQLRATVRAELGESLRMYQRQYLADARQDLETVGMRSATMAMVTKR